MPTPILPYASVAKAETAKMITARIQRARDRASSTFANISGSDEIHGDAAAACALRHTVQSKRVAKFVKAASRSLKQLINQSVSQSQYPFTYLQRKTRIVVVGPLSCRRNKTQQNV